MIIGIGTDLIEIARIENACKKEHFYERCFTALEQELIQGNPAKAAGNFAVKEAVSKVFGTGVSGFELTDIEVLRDAKGKPYVNLYNQALWLFNDLGIQRLHVSITNTKDHAQAFVIGEGGIK